MDRVSSDDPVNAMQAMAEDAEQKVVVESILRQKQHERRMREGRRTHIPSTTVPSSAMKMKSPSHDVAANNTRQHSQNHESRDVEAREDPDTVDDDLRRAASRPESVISSLMTFESIDMGSVGEGGTSMLDVGSVASTNVGHDDPTARASNQRPKTPPPIRTASSTTDSQFIDELSAIGKPSTSSIKPKKRDMVQTVALAVREQSSKQPGCIMTSNQQRRQVIQHGRRGSEVAQNAAGTQHNGSGGAQRARTAATTKPSKAASNKAMPTFDTRRQQPAKSQIIPSTTTAPRLVTESMPTKTPTSKTPTSGGTAAAATHAPVPTAKATSTSTATTTTTHPTSSITTAGHSMKLTTPTPIEAGTLGKPDDFMTGPTAQQQQSGIDGVQEVIKLEEQLNELDKAEEAWKAKMMVSQSKEAETDLPKAGDESIRSRRSRSICNREEMDDGKIAPAMTYSFKEGLESKPSEELVKDMDAIVRHARMSDDDDETQADDASTASGGILASDFLLKVSLDEDDIIYAQHSAGSQFSKSADEEDDRLKHVQTASKDEHRDRGERGDTNESRIDLNEARDHPPLSGLTEATTAVASQPHAQGRAQEQQSLTVAHGSADDAPENNTETDSVVREIGRRLARGPFSGPYPDARYLVEDPETDGIDSVVRVSKHMDGAIYEEADVQGEEQIVLNNTDPYTSLRILGEYTVFFERQQEKERKAAQRRTMLMRCLCFGALIMLATGVATAVISHLNSDDGVDQASKSSDNELDLSPPDAAPPLLFPPTWSPSLSSSTPTPPSTAVDRDIDDDKTQDPIALNDSSAPTPLATITFSPSALTTPAPSQLMAVPTSQPTESPKAAPTALPTVLPSSLPTILPTIVPSRVPTTLPTVVPTAAPTPSPSTGPTVSSEAPTAAETVEPSSSTTTAPTPSSSTGPTSSSESPTSAPTLAPSPSPTAAPTPSSSTGPTLSSEAPTSTPTLAPSPSPTAAPTLSPSADPTSSSEAPTSAETVEPSPSPTASSMRPSLVPNTEAPTVRTTGPKTISPTIPQTLLQSGLPTALQTTLLPTGMPTNFPTVTRSTSPTLMPTRAKTSEPTASPTLSPTTQPTVLASATPTQPPTSSPTSAFTYLPTQEPTVPPTVSPTGSPTKTHPIKQAILDVSGALIDDPSSPQHHAFEWLTTSDGSTGVLDGLSTPQLVDRYVAGVLYFSLGGDQWSSQFDSLSTASVCRWNDGFGSGIFCDDEGLVEEILLENNMLDGTVPAELAELSGLKTLDLRHNSIKGSIPSELGRLNRIVTLDMRENDLTGEIPPELFTESHTDLESLVLFANGRLSGAIPSTIGYATQLGMLSLQDCHLDGSIPTEIESLSNLSFVNLSNNNFIGKIPSALMLLPRLRVLALSANSLIGSIPPFGTQQLFRFLAVDHNNLTGTFPSSIGNLEKMISVMAEDNNLEGTIPTELASLLFLSDVHFSNNKITGTLPSFAANSYLQTMEFANNQFTGDVATVLDSLPADQLESLDLSSNAFAGSLTPQVGTLQSLTSLLLGNNSIDGSIPSEIGECTNLQRLELNGNLRMSGSVPSTMKQLVDLEAVHLQNTNLAGDLDSVLCSASFLSDPIDSLQADCSVANGNNATTAFAEVTCTCCTSCCETANDGTSRCTAL